MNRKIVGIMLLLLFIGVVIFAFSINRSTHITKEVKSVSYKTSSVCTSVNDKINCKCTITINDEEYRYTNTLSGDSCDVCSQLCKHYAEELANK